MKRPPRRAASATVAKPATILAPWSWPSGGDSGGGDGGGGGGGGGNEQRGPQSLQSVPGEQGLYSDAGPPSSQLPLDAQPPGLPLGPHVSVHKQPDDCSSRP